MRELTLHEGDPHLAITPDDTYPNQLFDRDYVVVTGLDSDQQLAAALKKFWQERGFNEGHLRRAWLRYLEGFKKPLKWLPLVRAELAQGKVFFLARKEQPVHVRGVVDLRFITSEGPAELHHGSVLVEHPDDPTNQWLVEPPKFAARYNWLEDPVSGLLIPEVE